MLFTAEQYKYMREGYSYCDRNCTFEISATPYLHSRFVGKYVGIFSRAVPQNHHLGINIRKFELIVQAVFSDVSRAELDKSINSTHILNLKEIVCAIVHWKMASQGGRAKRNVANVENKWRNDTFTQIMNAYRRKDLSLFKIDGVRIPTATAFLRFLFPDEYGIMDSRVVKVTQKNNITQLDIRHDGYIIDKKKNVEQYNQHYNPFLVNEAWQLNNSGITFQDIDEQGNQIDFKFRPCDVEMALFNKPNASP
jgi:hypothetical protein